MMTKEASQGGVTLLRFVVFVVVSHETDQVGCIRAVVFLMAWSGGRDAAVRLCEITEASPPSLHRRSGYSGGTRTVSGTTRSGSTRSFVEVLVDSLTCGAMRVLILVFMADVVV